MQGNENFASAGACITRAARPLGRWEWGKSSDALVRSGSVSADPQPTLCSLCAFLFFFVLMFYFIFTCGRAKRRPRSSFDPALLC